MNRPPHPAIGYTQCRWETSLEALLAVRIAVFVDEQAVPLALEVDDCDPFALHWLAHADGVPVATVRLVNAEKVGRLAVLAPWRGRGIATQLMALVETQARGCNSRQLILSAQQQALGFYRALGYRGTGEPFDDAGIPHQTMVKPLR